MATTKPSLLKSALAVILPKGNLGGGTGTALTTTFNPSAAGQVLSGPAFREHLTDIFDTRSNSDSRAIIQDAMRTDPDMSAALNAFLTVANTEPVFLVKNIDGTLDDAGQQILVNLLVQFQNRSDYSTGFAMPTSMASVTEAMRYMLLMRGGIGGELVLNKEFFPTEFRFVDVGFLQWLEPAPGQYKPRQIPATGGFIDLDIPSFFMAWFRKDPTGIYSYSPFISAINTIAARQQVINDLYRIMKITGYPRMEATILEDVILKNMPPDIKIDEAKKRTFIQQVFSSLNSQLSSLRPHQVFVHTDSVEMGVMNEKTAGMSLDITPIIETLNAQNQAGLKTMATIIGRGESGVNTASVEARVFSLSAGALNEPVAEWLSQALTLALRLSGSQSYVEAYFRPVEMRSETELETQLLVRSQRLRQDLSDGLISDSEYHLWMYNRLPPPGTPELSGTGFAAVTPATGSPQDASNSDSLTKAAVTPDQNKAARDNKSKVISKNG